MSKSEIPLFPLHAVLFPGGALPLRIFEPRYLDMVCGCMKKGTGFGVCLIREGREIGEAALVYDIGTFARIADWRTRHDGLLGITAVGERRFRTLRTEVQQNQLVVAEVEFVPDDPVVEIPERFLSMAELLRRVIEQIGDRYAPRERNYQDAGWVGCRLAELLPLPLDQKQYLLQLADPEQRLERLCGMLEGLDIV